jgi:hypothetical protein
MAGIEEIIGRQFQIFGQFMEFTASNAPDFVPSLNLSSLISV